MEWEGKAGREQDRWAPGYILRTSPSSWLGILFAGNIFTPNVLRHRLQQVQQADACLPHMDAPPPCGGSAG